MFFFFFQAEDGIRDRTVTGVQTCALPICRRRAAARRRANRRAPSRKGARLESRQLRMRQLSAAHSHAAELGAAVQGRDVLAGIEEALGVEGALHAVEALDLAFRELHAHLIDLLHAHAVLAGDGAADLDALLQHFAREALGALELV